MAENRDFAHLLISSVRQGKPVIHGIGKQSERTQNNISNRVSHGAYLKQRTKELSLFWQNRRADRNEERLPPIDVGVPVLLEIDPDADIAFLRNLGFEVVCEIDEGFIIVATEDVDFSRLDERIDEFIANAKKRCNTPARIYAMCEDGDRLRRVLSKELYEQWSTISTREELIVDLEVSCDGITKLPDRPKRDGKESDEHYNKRVLNWEEKCNLCYKKWDEYKLKREEEIRRITLAYNGRILNMVDSTSDTIDLPDSFSVRLEIEGRGLVDLVLNYAYIFEVSEVESIDMGEPIADYSQVVSNILIEAPDSDSPIVCIMDSGIQEEHKYLSPAIIIDDSFSYLPNDSDVSDKTKNGGHGTRVAGAVLFPHGIPKDGEYRLPCWIRNMRILDEKNSLPVDVIPHKAIAKAVQKYYGESTPQTKIYNHSIGDSRACEIKHMSRWATEIDLQSYYNDVLFIQSAGNVNKDLISAYLQKGDLYPKYLEGEYCRISDPAQSLQALTVGSVSAVDIDTEDYKSLGSTNDVSSFSRSGPGIWDTVKPDVVEYGGTHVAVKGSNPTQLLILPEACPELIRKSPEGPAFSSDDLGTSFSAPLVTYIAAQIQKTLPESPSLLYRALIAQSARWPKQLNAIGKEDCLFELRHLGYGIPDVNRAIQNDEYRVTLITPTLMEIAADEAHIFQIPIPEALSNVGEEFDILVEVTLSYAAKPRCTRRRINGYLSTWLDWCNSRIGEKANTFEKRIFETGSTIDDDGDFKWVIGSATNRGLVDGYSRKKGTLQKDWCLIKSNQLSDAFCVAVRGHKGWDELSKAKYSLAVSFEAINQDIMIYEPIRSVIQSVVETGEIEIET